MEKGGGGETQKKKNFQTQLENSIMEFFFLLNQKQNLQLFWLLNRRKENKQSKEVIRKKNEKKKI